MQDLNYVCNLRYRAIRIKQSLFLYETRIANVNFSNLRLMCRPSGWPEWSNIFGLMIIYKVKLSLCLISLALCHEDIWGSGGIATPFLTSALVGGEWSASRPCRFTHWIEGWVGPGVGLDALESRKSCSPGNRTRAAQPVVRRYTD
jgi:hypothetical protein